jgi:hypothetical protein
VPLRVVQWKQWRRNQPICRCNRRP